MMIKPEHEVTQITNEFPTNVYDADYIAEKTGVGVERLIELTEAGYIPHYKIDGNTLRFKITEVKKWLAVNLVHRTEGRPLENAIRIVYEAPPPTEKPPTSISNLSALQQIPVYGYQPGVYFLCKENTVVYVGQSITPHSRVGTHKSEGVKDFDRVYILPIPKHELDGVESAFIECLDPPQQGRHHATGKCIKPASNEIFSEVVARYTNADN